MNIKERKLKIMSKIENILGYWPFFLAALFIIAVIIILTLNSNATNNNEFTADDILYMKNLIEQKYGNGQKFILLDFTSRPIEKSVGYTDGDIINTYIGESCGLIGYFENNKDKGYYVGFNRYVSNSPYKQGNNVIIEVYQKDDFDITNYLKGGE